MDKILTLLMGLLEKLWPGKKRAIGLLAGAALLTVYSLDAMIHDNPDTKDVIELGWIAQQLYTAAAGWVGAWFGVSIIVRR